VGGGDRQFVRTRSCAIAPAGLHNRGGVNAKDSSMKIQLLRASNIVKEIEFEATLSPLDIRRLSIDLMFDHFERNETHLWPREEDIRGSRHEIQVISDQGTLLKAFDIREIVKEAGLKFLGRRVNLQA
jgi:hypothetical protein